MIITTILSYAQKYAIYIIVAIVSFGAGWSLTPAKTVVQQIDRPIVQERVITQTKTQIEYVPKIVYADKTVEKADVQVKMPPTEITVEVNGKQQTIQKADNEQFIFDKNKLTLDQQSNVALRIEVPVIRIDDTRNWQLGGMVGTDGLSVVGGYGNYIGQYEYKYNGGFEVAAGYVFKF